MMTVFVLALAVFISACTGEEEGQGSENQEDRTEQGQEEGADGGSTDTDGEQNSATEEEEKLVSLGGDDGTVVATATLTEADTGVTIKLEGSDLPEGKHGFHIHENAECEQPDFESAGGHFNPTEASHGFDNPDGPHAGDLPNIEVKEDGTVDEEVTADMVTLNKGEDNSLYSNGGTSLMIHAEEDDYETDPAGDAGDRIACGTIEE